MKIEYRHQLLSDCNSDHGFGFSARNHSRTDVSTIFPIKIIVSWWVRTMLRSVLFGQRENVDELDQTRPQIGIGVSTDDVTSWNTSRYNSDSIYRGVFAHCIIAHLHLYDHHHGSICDTIMFWVVMWPIDMCIPNRWWFPTPLCLVTWCDIISDMSSRFVDAKLPSCDRNDARKFSLWSVVAPIDLASSPIVRFSFQLVSAHHNRSYYVGASWFRHWCHSFGSASLAYQRVSPCIDHTWKLWWFVLYLIIIAFACVTPVAELLSAPLMSIPDHWFDRCQRFERIVTCVRSSDVGRISMVFNCMTRWTGVRVGNVQYQCRRCECMIYLHIIINSTPMWRVMTPLVPFMRRIIRSLNGSWSYDPIDSHACSRWSTLLPMVAKHNTITYYHRCHIAIACYDPPGLVHMSLALSLFPPTRCSFVVCNSSSPCVDECYHDD